MGGGPCLAVRPGPVRCRGRRIWADSFGGAEPQNLALNIGISGDHTEHLLHRILLKAQGGLGQFDAAALAPEFPVRMVGIDRACAPEAPVADSVFEGVRPVMRALHARLVALAHSAEFAGCTAWLDLYPAFVDAQGRQDGRLFVDGLHPSEAGYRLWRDRLVPALAAARALAR